ncbi:MAG: PhaM family polyhydroxyalkanoate granule multifunctional regulatory protein [Pseudomonadota bacterium]
MPTRPPSPDPANASGSNPSDSASAFGGMGAGLSFFQDWIKAAGSALPNMPGATGAAGGGSGAWSMPSLDPEELEKRIQDLRTVQFWLEQNARLISITIQGLEVQRMTLSTLQGMNVSMDSLRESLKAKPTAPTSPPPAAEPTAAAAEPSPAGVAGEPIVNPLRWWDTLTEQFKNLAEQTVQAAQASASASNKASSAAAAPASPPAKKAATATQAKAAAPARKATAAKTPASKAAGVRRRSSNTGDAD